MVEKFKIDSELIPLFHVDIKQPQAPVVKNTNYITNYNIYFSYYSGGFMHYYSVSLFFSQPFMKDARISRTDTSGNVYYDRTDPVFAMYSNDKFIGMVNDALINIASQAGFTNPPFFKYDHVLEKVCYYSSTAFPAYNIYFSSNLLPYIGEAFNTIRYEFLPTNVTEAVFSINIEQNTNLQTIEVINGINWIKAIQEYAAMSSWASINRILFISNRLPVRREFYPLASNNRNNPYENLPGMNIISSFLINSSNAGDYRTSINYSSGSIDDGPLIDLISESDILYIDVDVMWSDKNGNVYTINLGPNKQINIRLAFIME